MALPLRETTNQDPARQAAVATTARHFIASVHASPDSLQPGTTEEQLQEVAQGFGETIVDIAGEPEVQVLLPAIKDLQPDCVTRENLRAEIGESNYDLAVGKINSHVQENETDEAKTVKTNWRAQSAKLIDVLEQHGDAGVDVMLESETFTTARQTAIDVAKKEQDEATGAMKQDEEVQRAFAGREGDLQKFIDMQAGMVEGNQDFAYLFNLVMEMTERMRAEAAPQVGESALANVVEKPQ